MNHRLAAEPGPDRAPHVVPLGVLLAVFAALIFLTCVTVWVAGIDLGEWNLFGALAIATVKAALVALYFMHLRYDSPFNALLFVTGLAFLALFLGLTLLDAVAYQPDIETFREAAKAR
ncbi:MAG: cytochrome C oxidase subunit IV family protein [Thermoguttaceae bacterium]|nr:cytochrome C oxidase subunit IV family protein [Thermoguttaceae bacterium]